MSSSTGTKRKAQGEPDAPCVPTKDANGDALIPSDATNLVACFLPMTPKDVFGVAVVCKAWNTVMKEGYGRKNSKMSIWRVLLKKRVPAFNIRFAEAVGDRIALRLYLAAERRLERVEINKKNTSPTCR